MESVLELRQVNEGLSGLGLAKAERKKWECENPWLRALGRPTLAKHRQETGEPSRQTQTMILDANLL